MDIDFNEISSTISLSKKTRRKIESHERCCAKTSKGDRCTRKRKTTRYCGSHLHSRPYGEIDEDELPADASVSIPIPIPIPIREKPVIKVKDVDGT